MATDSLIKVGGVALPSPTKYDVKLIDVDSPASGRGDSGYMTRDRIRSNVSSIDVEWTLLNTAELNKIQAAIHPADFTVDYFVGGVGSAGRRVDNMYAGDRDITLVYYGNGNDEARWNFKLRFIQL